MRSLSMDLPPFPKSDSAEAFLTDAPQESSKLLYCQYLLGATKMKLILNCVLLGIRTDKLRCNWTDLFYVLETVQVLESLLIQ